MLCPAPETAEQPAGGRELPSGQVCSPASRVCLLNASPLLWDNQRLFVGASKVRSVPRMSRLQKRPLSLHHHPAKHLTLIGLVTTSSVSGKSLIWSGKYKETTLNYQAVLPLWRLEFVVLPSRRNLVQQLIPCAGAEADGKLEKEPLGRGVMGQTPDAQGNRRRWLCCPRPWASAPGRLACASDLLAPVCPRECSGCRFPPTEDWDDI